MSIYDYESELEPEDEEYTCDCGCNTFEVDEEELTEDEMTLTCDDCGKEHLVKMTNES